MDKKLIYKMIQNSCRQYYQEGDSIPLTDEDFEELYKKIISIKSQTEAALHEIIEDIVYEYVTNSL